MQGIYNKLKVKRIDFFYFIFFYFVYELYIMRLYGKYVRMCMESDSIEW